jgi:hypothetical protein
MHQQLSRAVIELIRIYGFDHGDVICDLPEMGEKVR